MKPTKCRLALVLKQTEQQTEDYSKLSVFLCLKFHFSLNEIRLIFRICALSSVHDITFHIYIV
jgi:hypothetical protein